jgi:hypothetical protein
MGGMQSQGNLAIMLLCIITMAMNQNPWKEVPLVAGASNVLHLLLSLYLRDVAGPALIVVVSRPVKMRVLWALWRREQEKGSRSLGVKLRMREEIHPSGVRCIIDVGGALMQVCAEFFITLFSLTEDIDLKIIQNDVSFPWKCQ